MANYVDIHSCLFRWSIFNPFLPWRRMEATFFHGSPTITKWIVTLRPMARAINRWGFSFSLKCVPSGENDEIIIARRVLVNISLNGGIESNVEEEDYRFWPASRYTYQFETSVRAHPLRGEPHHLVIDVEVSFPRQNIANSEGSGLLFDDDDLILLSEDLGQLFTHPSFDNMRLNSNDPLWFCVAHSYILRARWNDFFGVHPDAVVPGLAIETNISYGVLHKVLTYLYSGVLDTADPNWGNPRYMTELFQVIGRYKLHHLYKVFARDEARQVRTTRKHLNVNSTRFRLDGVSHPPLRSYSYRWDVNPDTNYEFYFRIQFFFSAAVPWFLYLLQSRSPHRIHAQVNLEFMKRVTGRPSISSVHERDYTIDPGERGESGTCHVEGNSADFNDFIRRHRRGRRSATIQYYMRCTLCLSDGTTATQVESEDDIGLLDNQARFNVLSEHMSALTKQDNEQDLRIKCRGSNNSNDTHILHKSIYLTRVPDWRAVLENVTEEMDIPDEATCILSSEAFRHVLCYIYTGKIFPIPTIFRDEIDNFAEKGGMHSLRSLIDRMHADA